MSEPYIPKFSDRLWTNYPELIEQGDNDVFAKTFNKMSGDYWIKYDAHIDIQEAFLSILIGDFNERQGEDTDLISDHPEASNE